MFLSNVVFKLVVMLLKWIRFLILCSELGMYYGCYIDNLWIDEVWMDFFFIVFLFLFDDYEGGVFVIDCFDGEEEVKLEEGSVVVYLLFLFY